MWERGYERKQKGTDKRSAYESGEEEKDNENSEGEKRWYSFSSTAPPVMIIKLIHYQFFSGCEIQIW